MQTFVDFVSFVEPNDILNPVLWPRLVPVQDAEETADVELLTLVTDSEGG